MFDGYLTFKWWAAAGPWFKYLGSVCTSMMSWDLVCGWYDHSWELMLTIYHGSQRNHTWVWKKCNVPDKNAVMPDGYLTPLCTMSMTDPWIQYLGSVCRSMFSWDPELVCGCHNHNWKLMLTIYYVSHRNHTWVWKCYFQIKKKIQQGPMPSNQATP